jgi:DNA-binding transcriptional ArsR family regulator
MRLRALNSRRFRFLTGANGRSRDDEIAAQFALSKPTLSGHFAVLREAGLMMAEKSGTTITYRLNISVLEDALLGFAHLVGAGLGGGRNTAKRDGEVDD